MYPKVLFCTQKYHKVSESIFRCIKNPHVHKRTLRKPKRAIMYPKILSGIKITLRYPKVHSCTKNYLHISKSTNLYLRYLFSYPKVPLGMQVPKIFPHEIRSIMKYSKECIFRTHIDRLRFFTNKE